MRDVLRFSQSALLSISKHDSFCIYLSSSPHLHVPRPHSPLPPLVIIHPFTPTLAPTRGRLVLRSHFPLPMPPVRARATQPSTIQYTPLHPAPLPLSLCLARALATYIVYILYGTYLPLQYITSALCLSLYLCHSAIALHCRAIRSGTVVVILILLLLSSGFVCLSVAYSREFFL
ncbi:uncharacterized protein J3D65DRAFT_626764 [Phyllosticta citribraziliensis]|uniref:Uncharacterized protein n=1 Tax=Phyllosticta citribraziliensis TaxID=989973 RepID=A0ABR1LMN2_9PEZI